VSCVAAGGGGSTGAGGASGATGSAGSAGSSGGSAGSSGATACSVPPTLGAGQQSLTWYYFGQGTAMTGGQYQTACGYLGTETGTDDTVANIAAPSDYFVAIPGATSSNFNTSNYCGACVQISNTGNGKSVTATVIDECPIATNPACASAGHLDVSKTAFDALGFATGAPSSGVSWKVVPCNVTGDVEVRVKSGNANQVYIENERLPIQSVTQNGAAATRLFYGAWQLPSNAAGTTLVLTDTSGRTVSIAVNSSTTDQDSGTQFPACQ
jgi:expansin